MRFQRRPVPIIIGGCHRSGTTLVRYILDAHSKIHCAPEVKFFRDLYGDYTKDDLNHIRFFSTARQMGLDEDELLSIFGKAFLVSHDLAAKKQGKKRWADKNPENVLYLKQWQLLLNGRFQFIHLVRHPLDTLASLIEAGFPKTVPSDFEGKVDVYRKLTIAGVEFSRLYPEKSFLVRYEDLVENPSTVISKLMDYLGEKYEPSMIDSFNPPERQGGLEDPKILATGSIHLKSIGRWKADLSPQQVDFVCNRCQDLFSRFNYPLP